MSDRPSLARLTLRGALKVPEITVYFWVIKALSTAMGESTSDYLVHALNPVSAVLLGFVGFLAALSWQFSTRRYMAWPYWLAVVGVGVFGTMAADVLHVGLGVPYVVSSFFYAVVLAAVFVSWQATEKTLSIHSVDSPRREAFYWAVVVATFAMGTALGDLTATTLHLGYFASGLLFAGVIAVPAVGYRRLGWNPIFCFWFAYVATRPLGASFADWMGKPQSVGGLGLGNGAVALVLTLIIIGLVAYLAITRRDVQGVGRVPPGAQESPPSWIEPSLESLD
ncbi:MAG: COG4705 family protein [Solirubrobacteraceae bacterium]